MCCFFPLQVIVKKDNKIQLLSKGADTIMFDLLNSKSDELKELTTHHLNVSFDCKYSLLYAATQVTAKFILTLFSLNERKNLMKEEVYLWLQYFSH